MQHHMEAQEAMAHYELMDVIDQAEWIARLPTEILGIMSFGNRRACGLEIGVKKLSPFALFFNQ